MILALLARPALVFSAPGAVPAAPLAAPVAAQPKTALPAPAPAAAQAGKPQARAVSPITEAAVRGGVLTCAKRIEQVTKYLTDGTQSGAFLFIPKTQPDQGIFSASIEVAGQTGTPIYASASFAPLANGQTGAVYDAVEYVAQTCDFVEKNVFKDLKRAGILRKDIVMLDGIATRVFLMPAGAGCVVIKKEVVQ